MSRDVLSFAVLLLACACAAETSELPDDSDGTPTGHAGSGGKGSGSAGKSAASGSQGEGAEPSDTPSEGGAPAEEGGSPSGGSSTAHAGKSSGTAGKGGTASGGSPPTGSGWKFPTNSEAWAASYAEPSALMGSSSVTWDSGAGNPDNGSLKLTIPFSGTDQKLDVSITLNSTSFVGKTITAKVKLDSGLSSSPDNPGGAKLYVKTGDTFVYADSGWTNLDNNWASVSLNVSSPAGYIAPGTHKPNDVREVGIEIATGSQGTYSSAVVHVDTVVY